MKVYTYSEARQRLSDVLNIARNEEVVIKRRGGETFSIIFRKRKKSPFDIPGIKTNATTKDILAAVRESRERVAESGKGGSFSRPPHTT
jgi:PHD/YefM family antitoxin component YafN of YafNO toxin-antitoxin module